MKQAAVRTYPNGYLASRRTIESLEEYLNKGYEVKFITPFIDKNGKTIYIEYIVEKKED